MVRLSSLKKLLLSSSLTALGLLAACEVAPPAAERRPQTRPAESGPTATAPQAPTQPAASQPAAAEPELPDYVTIRERYNPLARATVEVRPEPGNRLSIDTHNVRRLRIDHDRVPLNRRRSISLQLDGQGLEWLSSSKVEEFERSVNGVWTPVKSEARGRP
jgi:hypothetical protein